MTTDTFKNRIAFVYTKKNTIHSNYAEVIDLVARLAKGERVYPKEWTGSARHINLRDNSKKLEEILGAAKVKFGFGNDAPRGGITGDYYELPVNSRKQLKDVDFSNL